MRRITIQQLLILVAHAFVGWALCAAVMGIGMQITSMEITLTVHLIAAPIFFAGLSLLYFRYFNYTTPLQTAAVFLAVVVLMDFFVVAMLILKSFEMFTSIVGTWLPFALIFASTDLTGVSVRKALHVSRPVV